MPAAAGLAVLAVPLIDTSFVVARRIKHGQPVYLADRQHLHHRFENIGFSQRRTVAYLYGWCATLALAALAIAIPNSNSFLILLATRALAFAILVMSLDILLGFTGLASMGQAAYLGVGAYAAFAISMFPAGAAIRWFAPPEIALNGRPSGSATTASIPIATSPGIPTVDIEASTAASVITT